MQKVMKAAFHEHKKSAARVRKSLAKEFRFLSPVEWTDAGTKHVGQVSGHGFSRTTGEPVVFVLEGKLNDVLRFVHDVPPHRLKKLEQVQ